MKKIIYSLAVTMLLTTGTVFTSCNSASDKADRANDEVEDAQRDLDEAELQQQEAAIPAEWAEFKRETEVKIKENDVRIAELKVKMLKPGVRLDSLRQNRINALEDKNNDLRIKLRDYENNYSDWETFKREFNHDMDELGKAFKDLTIDNKK